MKLFILSINGRINMITKFFFNTTQKNHILIILNISPLLFFQMIGFD
jgi:hypothetical protein